MLHNRARVSWYNLSTVLWFIFRLPFWLDHKGLFERANTRWGHTRKLLGSISNIDFPCCNSALDMIFPLWITFLISSLDLTLGFLVWEHMDLRFDWIWCPLLEMLLGYVSVRHWLHHLVLCVDLWVIHYLWNYFDHPLDHWLDLNLSIKLSWCWEYLLDIHLEVQLSHLWYCKRCELLMST